MATIVVDPITRIEGHLRIEAEVADGAITQAWSSATMWRGIETILEGRDPRDAWYFTQRICGVCTTVHALASVRTVENALGIVPPPNAQRIRNLIALSQFVQDHVVHFYHLHALDWVDIVSALDADPQATAELAGSISDYPRSSAGVFRQVKNRLTAFVEAGQLGPFAGGYWGHPAYKLPPEANLMAVSHYLDALEFQRDYIRIHALLGGKNPHPQTYLVGGMATPIDPDSQAAINAGLLAELRKLLKRGLAFVQQAYIPDLLAIASFYKDWASIGRGLGNYMSFGEFPTGTNNPAKEPDTMYLPRGVILGGDLSQVHALDPTKIAEYVTHSWYSYSSGDATPLTPFNGETVPNFTGPEPPYEFLETDSKYSWLKAPRYNDTAMEVGPLARMLVAFAAGHTRVQEIVGYVLDTLGVGPEVLFSTLGRTAARGVETLLLAERSLEELDQLIANISTGDYRTHNGERWDPKTWPDAAQGFGMHEAPRGSLSHWITIKDKRIEHYQIVVPSTWNGSPRDATGNPGAYEAALVGTPVAIETQPLEILRTIHSFDPCMACAAHLIDTDGNPLVEVRVS
ncbi:hydrogenase-1 large chain [bacterium BMS3Abin02]|nr:hydrogenase-1 large chain [bacterium BMS3Abin02]GBE22259.1 hydrogenase-1 large chain [bacterium BMS3Bbin01]HDH26387.1 nickel-dependent hydrogenase large subunit [Actinomycetota bacterium]HDL50051.1 nickel-dependent hydrogenase large subunit [Actinomycetota bacterium]